MRGISSLLALLLVIGITLASTILVSRIIAIQVGRSSESPLHLQVIDKNVVKISSYIYEIKVTFYNPSDRIFKVYPEKIILYTNGFRNSIPFLIIDSSIASLFPGETSKLEVIGKSTSRVDTGVMSLIVYVEDIRTNTGYQDVIIIPIR